jgi:predicted HAD superfamily Cof-like phosphohydrolase
MTTVVDVVDTAVKIGLGAFITGIIAYVIAKTSQSHEFKKTIRDEKIKLIREYALHVEHLEAKLNACIIASGENDFVTAKASLSQACSEGYSARSVANLLSSDNLVKITDEMCDLMDFIYPVLLKANSEIFDKVHEVAALKKTSYTYVRKLYDESVC